MRTIVASIEAEYLRYKVLAERAMDQLADEQRSRSSATGNSVAALVWHIAGNLESRFTDFLHADGEKPWRDREGEFARRTVSRAELREKWEKGWTVLLGALAPDAADQIGSHA
jgi:Protein of unknown function (DUF1572)